MILGALWKWVGGGLLFLSLMLGLALAMERRHAAKLQSRVNDLTEQLHKLSATKNQQKQTTDRNIGETRIIIRDGNKAAEKIERAPTAPDCKTPAEIMGADL